MTDHRSRGHRRWWGWGETSVESHDDNPPMNNNNEINSNYMDSIENDQEHENSYSFDELTGSFSLDDDEVREQFGDTSHDLAHEESDEDIFVSNQNTIDAPDAFTEAAQNDYNAEVERIMQESRGENEQPRADDQDNTDGNLPETPIINNRVEVDLLGIEASTTLMLLGLGVLVISRWYALGYFFGVVLLLMWLRRRARQEAARANIALQIPFEVGMPRIFADLADAFKCLGAVIGALCLIPVMIVGGLIWLSQALRPAQAASWSRSRPQGASDLKFLFQLMFFPFFIPFWLHKLQRRQPASAVAAHGPNTALLRSVVRFLQRGRHR